MGNTATASGIAAESALMKHIRDTLGMQIRAAVTGTPIPESFVAALVANESGGTMGSTRYEPAELGRFALVLCGKQPSHQGITGAQLLAALSGKFSVKDAVTVLVNYCTSWGPTQIMGYHAIKGGYLLSELALPSKHFSHAVEMLLAFSREFRLPGIDRSKATMSDGSEYFLCWNTGRPDGKTFDPNYAAKGLARMQMYEALP